MHRVITRYFDIQPILVPICAILLAFAVGGVIILLVGENPITAYWALLRGMFGGKDAIAASLGRSTPFIGAALAVAFAFRAGLFNIGVEGQLLIGATVAAWVGTWHFVGDLPAVLAVLVVLVAGVFGGGLYGAVPGVLKARTGAHEVITTIMLNSIAILYVRWMVGSQDPVILRDMSASVPRTALLPDGRAAPQVRRERAPVALGLRDHGRVVLRRVVRAAAHDDRLRDPHGRRQPERGTLRGRQREPRDRAGDGGVRRVRRAGRRGRDHRHDRVPEPGHVREHRLRLDRDRAARAAPTRSR